MTKIYRHCKKCGEMFHIKHIHLTDIINNPFMRNIMDLCKKCEKGEEK